MLALALAFGVITCLANLLGGYLSIAQRRTTGTTLVNFIGFGGGFLLAAALLEILPESLKGGGPLMPLVASAGYLVVYVAEHLFASRAHEESHSNSVAEVPHGEHTLAQEFRHEPYPITRAASLAALIGFNVHDFIDGLAIGAGVLTSTTMGVLIFVSILAHEVPAGFAVGSVMRGAGFGRKSSMLAATSIGVITLVAIPISFFVGSANDTLRSAFIALAAGTFIYIAASDLIPAASPARSKNAFLFVLLGFALFYVSQRLIGA